MATNEELEKRVAAIEAHLAKLPAGTVRFVPGVAEVVAEQLSPYQQVTAELNREQLISLENAGLTSVKKLQQAAVEEDGFTKIDGLGKAADRKLRQALEAL